MAEGVHFESEYFLALTYLPPEQTEERVKGFLFDGQRQFKSGAQKSARLLQKPGGVRLKTSSVRCFRSGDCEPSDSPTNAGFPADHDDLLRYVHRCVTMAGSPVCLAGGSGLSQRRSWHAGLWSAASPRRSGRKHLRVDRNRRISAFELPRHSGALDNLAIEYRWHTRAILLDPEEARGLLDKTRRKWRSKIRGWKDQLLRTETGPTNLYAQEMAADAEEAMSVAASGDVQFCLYTTLILCFDDDRGRLEESAALVVKTVQNLGFACRIESVNALDAWRGSLPGDGYRNARRVILHTLNLADMMPITAVWAGSKMNPSPLMPTKQPAADVRGDDRCDSVPCQSTCRRSRAHPHGWASGRGQINIPRVHSRRSGSAIRARRCLRSTRATRCSR